MSYPPLECTPSAPSAPSAPLSPSYAPQFAQQVPAAGFAQPAPQQIVVQPTCVQPTQPQTIIMMSATQPSTPICRHCNQPYTPVTEHYCGTNAWLFACVIALVCFPLACLPLCVESLQDSVVVCNNCRKRV